MRLIVPVILAVAALLAFFLWPQKVDQAPVSAPQLAPGEMTEEERVAYVKANVRAADLDIVPDTKPGMDEEVPGLMRVTGKLVNEGDRWVDKVIVVVYPKDAAGEVLGVEQADVVETRLEPEEIIDFHFQVRKRPEYSGNFDHELR